MHLFGVETVGAKKMYDSLQQGQIVTLEKIETVAEGLAAKRCSERTFSIIRDHVKECFVVSDKQTMDALRELLQNEKILSEPSASCSIAALDQIFNSYPQLKNVCIIVCGGNFGIERLNLLQESAQGLI